MKVFVPGRLNTDSGELRVHMLNVSIDGAMLHVTQQLAPGKRVRLTVGPVLCDASIAWAHRDRIGLRFCVPLDELPAI